MIVVDAHMIATLLLNSEKTELARKVLLKDSAWVAPLLWRSEFRQLLAYYLRKGVLTLRQATMVVQEAENLMQGGQFDVPSPEILALTEKHDCTAYAAEYIALAQELGVPLVTIDKMFLRKFPGIAIHADTFINQTVIHESILAESL
jgi:predicted nucleic acid-binding protein